MEHVIPHTYTKLRLAAGVSSAATTSLGQTGCHGIIVSIKYRGNLAVCQRTVVAPFVGVATCALGEDTPTDLTFIWFLPCSKKSVNSVKLFIIEISILLYYDGNEYDIVRRL